MIKKAEYVKEKKKVWNGNLVTLVSVRSHLHYGYSDVENVPHYLNKHIIKLIIKATTERAREIELVD